MISDNNLILDHHCLDVKVGQKRIFHESERIFTNKEKTYNDRNIWTCVFENGEEETHRGTIIACHSTVIIGTKEE